MGYSDTRWVVEQICRSPAQYSWQVLNWKIAIKELAVSGCDYMTAFRNKRKLELAKQVLFGNKELVNRLIDESEDFVVADTLPELMDKMDAMSLDGAAIDREGMAADIAAYDAQIARGPRYFNDDQLRRIAASRTLQGGQVANLRLSDHRRSRGEAAHRHSRVHPQPQEPGRAPDRPGRGGCSTEPGEPIPGLYAVGETAGFGGGGIHGKGSLEGTFLGSCVLTGRLAARAISDGP